MVFDEKIKTAFEVLRNAATNDFERHRIDVLENDLTCPPTAEVVDETHQRFNGLLYHKANDEHYNRNRGIHVDIWCYYHGDIPNDGTQYDVHHDDGNPANNAPNNLILLTRAEHAKIHATGRHTRGYKRIVKKTKKYVCQNCGVEFVARANGARRYCSVKCRIQAHNKRHVKNCRIFKTCAFCGKSFPAIKANAKYCSHVCHRSARIANLEEKICPICGNSFVKTNINQIYCSPKCSNLAKTAKRKERKKLQREKESAQPELPFNED